jgi:hypothetical protein
MNLKNIIKKHLILEQEERVAELSDNITVDFGVFKKDHVNYRQNRHVSDKDRNNPCYGKKITNYDMVNLIDDSLSLIIEEIVNGNISNGSQFIVTREGDDYLNVVIIPQNTRRNKWNLIIKTVMCEENFKMGSNQLQILVPTS